MNAAAAARRWLEEREPQAPPALRSRMLEAVGRRAADADEAGTAGAHAGVATVLAEAAIERLRSVLASPGDREAAWDLLTADALLTGALEAAAEAGPEALLALAEAYGPERLAAELLEQGRDGR